MVKNLIKKLLLVTLFFLCFSTAVNAAVQKGISKKIITAAKPLDLAVSADGKKTFVLLEGGIIQVIGTDGSSQGTIKVSKSVVSIEASPNGETLLLADNDNSTVKVVALDFIVDINIAGSPFKGPPDAPIIIAEFSCFQWPYSAKVQPLLEQVLKKYPNSVKLVFKNFPLTRIHKFAMNASVAALAAHQQGKFWEYHQKLFENYNQLNDEKFDEIAQAIGLDMAQFKEDMKNPALTAMVQRDLKDGVDAGVRGTPTIFINGRLLQQRSIKGFTDIIDDELKNMDKKNK